MFEGKSVVKVGTHPGMMHADDVFAVACIYLLVKITKLVVSLVRTRDEVELAKCDVRIDIGRKYDPEMGDFDHHQEGGAGTRSNGVPYSSFGLIWKQFGQTLCQGFASAAEEIDAKLVRYIDYRDTGGYLKEIEEDLPRGVEVYSISRAIRNLNPPWNESQDFDAAFEKALDVALIILEGEIKRAVAGPQAKLYVQALVEENIRCGKSPVLILDKTCPWVSGLRAAPWILYVIYPSAEDHQWMIQAVTKRGTDPKQRIVEKPFPPEWAGKANDELVLVTGVDDACFCHEKRHIAKARTVKGAESLAALALQYSGD